MFFKNNSTKEEILQILSKSWPLSITEIRNNGQFNTSYQYVRQCIKELIEAKIISKKGMKYELSKDWLKTIHKFSQTTLNNYQFGVKNNLLNKETTQVQVNSLNEMGHFMLEALECRLLEPEDKRGFFCLLNHLWIPFTSKEKQKRLLLPRSGEYC